MFTKIAKGKWLLPILPKCIAKITFNLIFILSMSDQRGLDEIDKSDLQLLPSTLNEFNAGLFEAKIF